MTYGDDILMTLKTNGEETLMTLMTSGEGTLTTSITTHHYLVTTPHDITDDPCDNIDNLEQIPVKYIERLMGGGAAIPIGDSS
jgi:hypothetical protein